MIIILNTGNKKNYCICGDMKDSIECSLTYKILYIFKNIYLLQSWVYDQYTKLSIYQNERIYMCKYQHTGMAAMSPRKDNEQVGVM